MVKLDNPLTKINHAHTIIGHLGLAPGMKVLEAGCGPGRLTLPAADVVGPRGEVLAMDIQNEMLTRVREKVHTVSLQNVQYLQAGLGEGKLKGEYFD